MEICLPLYASLLYVSLLHIDSNANEGPISLCIPGHGCIQCVGSHR